MMMDLERFVNTGVHELSQVIDEKHQDMLEADTVQQKQEMLRQLRGYITEFLYQVSPRAKFKLEETEKVLAQSIYAVADFDPREAMWAFEDLAKYAHNLLEQPWRKEFHRINLTSGFYLHNIKAHLRNPQDLLIVLGYAGTDDYTLELHTIAGPDILKAFSRDCYVASHECLILSQAWERLQRNLPEVYPFILFEAWEARKSSIADVDTLCQQLLGPVKKKLYEMQAREIERKRQLEHDKLMKMRHSALERTKISDEELRKLSSGNERFDDNRNANVNIHSPHVADTNKVKDKVIYETNLDGDEPDHKSSLPAFQPLERKETPIQKQSDSMRTLKLYSPRIEGVTATFETSNHCSPKNEEVTSKMEPLKLYSPKNEEIITKVERWNCKFCTFINLKEERICEMCAKSKDLSPDDDFDNGYTTVV